MKTFLEQINQSISTDKELVEIMPKNGIKKQRELKEKITQLTEKYERIQQNLEKEIGIRYKRLTNVKENPQIKETYDKILNLAKAETINNNEKSSFEKMQLDRLVYDINGYYKKNLSITNKNIYECIQKFKKVGINVTEKDFDVSENAQEYIKVLLEEAKDNKLNSNKIKNKFEEVYWKSSDLIYQVLVGIRCIYDKYEEQINQYFEEKSQNINQKLNEDLKIKRIKLDEKYNELKYKDEKNILDNFFDGKNAISDFSKNNYNNFYVKIVEKTRDQLEKEEAKDVDANIIKLNANLVEYFRYLEYKFINDETLKIKKDIEIQKAKLANQKKNEKEDKKSKKDSKKQKKLSKCEEIREQIEKKKDEINKLNLAINHVEVKSAKNGGLFKKKAENDENGENLKISSDEKENIVERDKKILELKDLYVKLDDARFEKCIENNLGETATIYDILRISTYYYGFLAKCLIKQNSDITPKEVSDKIVEIKDFVENFNFGVINHINIDEKKDIAVIIKDKFKLTGFNLVKDDINENGIEDTIKQTQMVLITNYINKSSINMDDIEFVMKAREILEKK